MRYFITMLLLIINTITLRAQTIISGQVKDNKGTPIGNASITIKDSYDGAVSDSTGKFKFSTTEKGQKLFIITAVGYKGFEQQINIDATLAPLSFSLKEEQDEMKAVVITAGSFEASDRKRTTVLSSIDIVTTASANADVTGAIKTLPGAQQVGESEGLFCTWRHRCGNQNVY